MTVEEKLRRLQNALRTPRPEFGGAEIAEGLRAINPVTGESTLNGPRKSEWALGLKAREALIDDLRFEHLVKPEAKIGEFMADCIFRPKDNTVYLSGDDGRNTLWWSCWISMFRSLDSVARHLPFDDARVRSMASGRE